MTRLNWSSMFIDSVKPILSIFKHSPRRVKPVEFQT